MSKKTVGLIMENTLGVEDRNIQAIIYKMIVLRHYLEN